MEALWFTLVSLMLVTYVVMDGFDFGVGVLHLFVARNDGERRAVLNAIGPIWDGNEVWLIASGGVLFFAFPKVYAAGFSGFYMPLVVVLWLLVLRGISIEFRSHQENPLWRSFWDGMFAFSSTLMAIVLGAALGNIIRGVPLDENGFFTGPLFTDFRPGTHPGVLDWYTVLVGVFALAVLAGHGALFLVWKTSGAVRERSRAIAIRMWGAVTVIGLLTTFATWQVQPMLYRHLMERPWTYPLVLLVVGSLVMVFTSWKRDWELPAFLASAGFITSMLAGTLAGLYPNMLTSTLDPAHSLTAANSFAGGVGPYVGLVWWMLALVLTVVYFAYLYRLFHGKVEVDEHGY
jgi:cytochrome d ubiquinol oxidase subunit II